ncbi:MAG: VPLPA-CTERM-specific exosortase XrtD [Alphaproteobacteria bacterium]|nr:VPLPA-CTERM-specific exosortase XrtD [Alphaproteobacteria bacterium]
MANALYCQNLPTLRPRLFLTLSLVALISCFSPTLWSLFSAWGADEYSHAPLIVPLAALIGWHLLTEKKPQLAASWWGVLGVFVGLLLLVVSSLSAFEPPSNYGMLLAIVGFSLAFFGKATTRTLAPAFVYLLFAIPLPKLIYTTLSSEMQLISSTLGVYGLRLFGFPVFQEGNIIDLGIYKLQVVEACSGLRYLFPLMSFSFLIAFLFKDAAWKRGFIFLSAIPLSIFMNSLRITIIGITVNLWGIEMAEGLLHLFEGWVIFTLCLVLLFIETTILGSLFQQNGKRGNLNLHYFGLPQGAAGAGTFRITPQSLSVFILCLFFSVVSLSGVLHNRKESIPARQSFLSFPLRINDWTGEQKVLSKNELATLQLTDYWFAEYHNKANNPPQSPINLYMAYYANQRVNASIHSPSNCLPGSGWKIEEKSIVPVALNSQSFPVTRMIIRRNENEALLVYYWFQGRGRILNEQYGAKWYLFLDSLLKNRSDGALVRLTTALPPDTDVGVSDQHMTSFLYGIVPLLDAYIPSK